MTFKAMKMEHTGQADRLDILSVVNESHLELTKTNSVLSSADTVKGLHLGLVYALYVTKEEIYQPFAQ